MIPKERILENELKIGNTIVRYPKGRHMTQKRIGLLRDIIDKVKTVSGQGVATVFLNPSIDQGTGEKTEDFHNINFALFKGAMK